MLDDSLGGGSSTWPPGEKFVLGDRSMIGLGGVYSGSDGVRWSRRLLRECGGSGQGDFV